MTGGPDLLNRSAAAAFTAPRRQRRLAFVSLAGLMAVLGVAAAAYYFAMRPVTLRVAVGPANSDDLKVVQTLAQAFNNQRNSQIRLRPVPTEGATASAQSLAEGKADLAIIRGDLDVPKNAQAVATLRKNVAVLWVPPAAKAVKGKKAPPKITKIAQLAGQPHRRDRPHAGQRQSVEDDPAAIRRRSEQGRDHPVPCRRGRGSHPQPEGRRLDRGGPGQQQDHDRRDPCLHPRRRHADHPRHRSRRRHRAEPSGL